MSTFQLIVTGVFVALIIIGVGVFAIFGGVGGTGGAGKVVIWGTADQQTMVDILSALSSQDNDFHDVSYVQKRPAAYQSDIINAIASGASPDLFLMTQEDIGALSGKVLIIPYGAVSQGVFSSSYIDEGQLFLTPQGEMALPFAVDPLVMYWNRDLLATAGEGEPPATWNDLLALAPKITSLDAGSNVKRSAAALGTWSNVAHAKAILSALFMQAGDYVTARDQNGALTATLGSAPAGAASGASDALRFYADFANPSKTAYSWNRALPNSADAFVAGQLAIYFGFASEYKALAARNPNVRFGVSIVPQLAGGGVSITYGALTGVAIARGSANPSGAMTIAQKLTSAAAAGALAQFSGLPGARRDVSLDTSQSAAMSAFMRSALIARGWADPNTAGTDSLFKDMIESVLSGKSDPAQAVSDAAVGLRDLVSGR